MAMRKLTVLAAAVLLGTGVLAAGPASASTGWTVQPTPDPGHEASLSGVSCLPGGTCEAVGSYRPTKHGSVMDPLAMRKTSGSGWQKQAVPSPASGHDDQLGGVSCVSSSSCEAVGSQAGNGGRSLVTIAEIWNGSRWRLQPMPSPQGRVELWLSAVSCASAAMCVAVGWHSPNKLNDRALTEVWNGKSWAIAPIKVPFGDVQLTGVSCPRAGFCMAVGEDNSGNVSAIWNGSSWAVSAMPGGSSYGITAVSCASATACTAVGFTFNGTAARGLAERWNGTRWSVQPRPSGELNAVSCPTARRCVAAGQNTAVLSQPKPVADSWSSTRGWTRQNAVMPPAAAHAELDGLSCVSPGGCTAVGDYQVSRHSSGARPLAEQR
jgi:hypothetical protein